MKSRMWLMCMLLVAGHVLAHGQIHDLIAKVDNKLALDPGNAGLYVDRAQLYIEVQHFAEAVVDCEKALSLEPARAEAHYFLGVAELGMRHFEAASAAVGQALTLAPAADVELRARAYFLLGDIAVADNRWPAAVTAYEDAIRVAPSSTPDQYLYYVDALIKQGPEHYGHAVTVLQQGMQALGPVTTLENRLLDVYLLQHDMTRALALLDTMIARGYSREVLWFRKGEIYQQAGDALKAKDAFNHALLSINELPPHRQNTRHIKEWKQKILLKLKEYKTASPAAKA